MNEPNKPINLLKDASPYISTAKTVDWCNVVTCDAGARDFWERCVLACLPGTARAGQPDAACCEACEIADDAAYHWRKRFDPREKA